MVHPCPLCYTLLSNSSPSPVLPFAIFCRTIPLVLAGCLLGSAVSLEGHPLPVFFSPRLYHCETKQALVQTHNSWKGSGTLEATQPLPAPPPPQHQGASWVHTCPCPSILFSCEMGILLWGAAHLEDTPVCCPSALVQGRLPHETPMNISFVFAPVMCLPHPSRRRALRLLTLPLGCGSGLYDWLTLSCFTQFSGTLMVYFQKEKNKSLWRLPCTGGSAILGPPA